MEMTGEYRIPASRAQVWAALNDPEILKASIPGCESLDMTSETEMTAKVVSKIGPVKATFTGKVRLENINAPESYTIAGEGQGGVAGFAKGGADVKLAEDGAETVLAYTARAQIGGKLAQLGSRLVDSTAKMMADQFFAKFSAIVTERSVIASGGISTGEVDMAIEVAEASVAAPAEIEAPLTAPAAAVSSASTSPASNASASSSAANAPRPGAASPAPASPTSLGGLPGWVLPVATLIIGLIIGKFL